MFAKEYVKLLLNFLVFLYYAVYSWAFQQAKVNFIMTVRVQASEASPENKLHRHRDVNSSKVFIQPAS